MDVDRPPDERRNVKQIFIPSGVWKCVFCARLPPVIATPLHLSVYLGQRLQNVVVHILFFPTIREYPFRRCLETELQLAGLIENF